MLAINSYPFQIKNWKNLPSIGGFQGYFLLPKMQKQIVSHRLGEYCNAARKIIGTLKGLLEKGYSRFLAKMNIAKTALNFACWFVLVY